MSGHEKLDFVTIKAVDIDPLCGHRNIYENDGDKLADFFFICGQDLTPIKAHKSVINGSSKLLSRAISASMDIKSFLPIIPFIVLTDYSATDVCDVLKYIYHGVLEVEKSRLPSIVKTAKVLGIKGLSELAIDKFIETPTAAFETSSETQSTDITSKNKSLALMPSVVPARPASPENPSSTNLAVSLLSNFSSDRPSSPPFPSNNTESAYSSNLEVHINGLDNGDKGDTTISEIIKRTREKDFKCLNFSRDKKRMAKIEPDPSVRKHQAPRTEFIDLSDNSL